jgi:hypothetical protein
MTEYAFEHLQSAKVLLGYLQAALWTNNLDGFSVSQFDVIDAMRASRTIDLFLNANADDVWSMIADGHDFEQVGYDLWLTRNRHGAGFWARATAGDYGDENAHYTNLTDAAHALGESDAYVGDNGTVYLT